MLPSSARYPLLGYPDSPLVPRSWKPTEAAGRVFLWSHADEEQNACRYYRDDPVPDEVLYNAVELARFAPNGGNRGAVRFVFARDPVLKRQLGAWYLPLWREVSGAARAGAAAIAAADGVPRDAAGRNPR